MEKIKVVIISWWQMVGKQLQKRIGVSKKELYILLFMLSGAAVVRLWKIAEYMTFLGDEGRDAIIVRRLLVFLDPILIGPGTSIGNMYLGPLYYYFMAPWLFLFGGSPVGPAIGVALLGVATVFLLWLSVREWFGDTAAWFAALFYSISPTVIIYSRSSWNPNIMPFFALLAIYSVWKIVKANKPIWYLTLGVSFAFVLQSHYLGLLLLPTIFVFWLSLFLKIRVFKLFDNWRLEFGNFLRYTLLGLVVFAGLMSPLVIFDSRHNWQNALAIKKFFSERQTTVSARPWSGVDKVVPIYNQVNSSLIAANDIDATYIVTWGSIWTIAWICYGSFKRRKVANLKSLSIVLSWLGFGVLGLTLYKQQIYDHYFGFLFPAVFVLSGALFAILWKHAGKAGRAILLVVGFYLVLANVINSPLKYPPNKQFGRSMEVAEKIVKEADFKRFNLAVIAERNYEDAYQYILEWRYEPVVEIDPLNYEATLADQLFVVCEVPMEKCDPTHNPKAQIANFGWSKVGGQWDISGVTLYRLVHSL